MSQIGVIENNTNMGTIAADLNTAQENSQKPEPSPPSSKAGDGLLLPLFMATIFLSSVLVFSVQPLFAKMVLPLLGGAPGVWNTAMLFFQIVLLASYGYAHLTTRFLGVRWQACLHVSLMALILAILPIGVATGWTPPVDAHPVLWLIGLFAVSVGLPFFAVATNAPLLQRWFSHTGHHAAADPYFLYAASNLGSILALLSYPLIFEPLLTSHEQSQIWGWTYAILIGLILICAIMLWRQYVPITVETASPSTSSLASPDEKLTLGQRLHWLVLAFVPSSLLLGVTMHITTDVAAVPLLWVLPLMLYLLTFVIVFARRPWLRHSWMVMAQPFFLIMIVMQRFNGIFLNTFLPLAIFFITAMVCHGELAKRRPGTSHLTEFYLWLSLGGMLGGVFNVLVAPLIFNSVFEFPLMLVIAYLLRPRQDTSERFFSIADLLWPAGLMTLLIVSLWIDSHSADWGNTAIIIFWVGLVLGMFSFRHQPIRFSLGIAATLFLTTMLSTQDQVITRERSFFGVNTVQRTANGDFNLLVHGRIIHGAQYTNPTRWKEPLTYYHQQGPLGQIFSIFEQEKTILENIAVIGLGVGTSACYQKPGQRWTFHEIDPIVAQLAQDTRYFHYLSECGDKTNIVYGDARLSLETIQDDYYDLLIIDAFSSDAIPMHLITREALTLYVQKITAKGILIFHISNTNLELGNVMSNLAADAGLTSWIQRYRATEEQQAHYHMSSDWVIMARSMEDLSILDEDSRWQRLIPNPQERIWSDDYSNILSVIKWESQ